MSYITLEISDNPFVTPNRVLNFGKYKGWTVRGVHNRQPGYLAWCRNTFGNPFIRELNDAEQSIVLSDHAPVYTHDYYEKSRYSGYSGGIWGDAALWCGTWCEADTF